MHEPIWYRRRVRRQVASGISELSNELAAACPAACPTRKEVEGGGEDPGVLDRVKAVSLPLQPVRCVTDLVASDREWDRIGPVRPASNRQWVPSVGGHRNPGRLCVAFQELTASIWWTPSP